MENPFEIILEKIEKYGRMPLRNSIQYQIPMMILSNIEQVASFIGLSKATIYGLTT